MVLQYFSKLLFRFLLRRSLLWHLDANFRLRRSLEAAHNLLHLEFFNQSSKSKRVKCYLLDNAHLARAWTETLENLRLHRLKILPF